MIFHLLTGLTAVGLLALARKSRPADDKRGCEMIDQHAATAEPQQLTVATYNIQTGKDLDGRRNLLASAEVVARADLVGVQEVYAPTLLNLLGLGSDQTMKIAKHGQFSWLFCATRRRWLREHRGNAILSKLPIEQWRIEMLPDQSNKSFRNMTIAQVTWQNQTFHFINTHLHTRKGQARQLEVVLQEFAKYPRAILVGDFNCGTNSSILSNALKDVDITDAVAAANLNQDDLNRIDWILTKGFTVEGGTMVEKGISDHPYFEVKLSFNVT